MDYQDKCPFNNFCGFELRNSLHNRHLTYFQNEKNKKDDKKISLTIVNRPNDQKEFSDIIAVLLVSTNSEKCIHFTGITGLDKEYSFLDVELLGRKFLSEPFKRVKSLRIRKDSWKFFIPGYLVQIFIQNSNGTLKQIGDLMKEEEILHIFGSFFTDNLQNTQSEQLLTSSIEFDEIAIYNGKCIGEISGKVNQFGQPF
ncbi:DgyrCDS14809 [Dimorphilus gyrociliatus]|uniref:DgyrCDS14809 n=1 Tax=Dimorphilus gyrociliatus TaxID=2664684 RepID=A0A7I8WEX4_9ANNE|nr:DgyrCDS14809 [Dimorphilus gyrociliatus]